jgi:hypothetical protein
MLRGIARQARSLSILFAAVALVAAACSSSGATAAPATAANPTGAPAATAAQAGDDGVGSANANLSNLTSYKFKMTLAGGDYGDLLAAFGGSSGVFTVTGTVVNKPQVAADMVVGDFHIIEIGGSDYMDMGNTGSFVKTTSSGIADNLSPKKIFAGVMTSSMSNGWSKSGSETKNGVQADHFQASASSTAELASVMGVTDATWSADLWLAKSGGYPVGIAIVAKAKDGSVAYEMSFDLSDVNSSSNSVTVPTNVAGA